MSLISSGSQIVGVVRSQIDGNSTHWTHLKIRNNDSTKTLYVGNADVTLSNGLPIDKLTTLDFDIPPNTSIYMVSDSGDHNISWLRIVHY